MADEDTSILDVGASDPMPEIPADVATGLDDRKAAGIRARMRRGQRGEEALPAPKGSEEYEALAEGTSFIDPQGGRRVKPYRPQSADEYANLPEGVDFIDPTGELRTTPTYEPVDFTAQTLYNMSVNDKERRKALERSYPGKVKENEHTGKLFVDDDGVLRRPKGFRDAPGAAIVGMGAPVAGGVAGEIAGGIAGGLPTVGIGALPGAIAGAGVGSAVGQTINDIVLALAGVYDRSAGEQAKETGIATAFGAGGTAVGRVIAGAAPAAKGAVKEGLPGRAASFLGAEKEGLETAIGLAEKGERPAKGIWGSMGLTGSDMLVPPSGWAKEAPHIINITQVFDPAFRTQKPMLQSATQHYEKEAGGILESMGVTRPPEAGSISKPAAEVSTVRAGEALKEKALAESGAADARLRQALDARTSELRTEMTATEGYHGSTDVIAEFDPGKTRLGRGLFFSERPQVASKFAERRAVDSDPLMIFGENDPADIKRWVIQHVGRSEGERIALMMDEAARAPVGADGTLSGRASTLHNAINDELRSISALSEEAGGGAPNVTRVRLNLGKVYEIDLGGKFSWDKELEAITFAQNNGYNSVKFTNSGEEGAFYSVFDKVQVKPNIKRGPIAEQKARVQQLQQAETDARVAAQRLIDVGFQDIQAGIDTAMKVAKAGGNSGDLWWSVGEKLRAVKQGIQERARIMYGQADELAGTNLPDASGLPELAQRFLGQLPEGFEGKYPSIVQQIRALAGREAVLDDAGKVITEAVPPVTPTFGQLHNLRSILRQNYNSLDLTPDIKQGVFKFFANRVDGILSDPGANPALRDAARALREADTFYRESMGPLGDKNIQAVMNGLESGMPADPKNLFDTLIKEGRSDLTRRVQALVGPNLWAGVKAADMQEMLDLSKTLVPDVIDGKRFAAQVLDRDRHGMLEAVHGREATQRLVQQAQNIEMLAGRLDLNVRPGDTVTEVIGRARQAAEAVKAEAKADPLKTLNKEMKNVLAEHGRELAATKRAREQDPLGFLFKPTTGAAEAVDKILASEDLVLAAAARFGEQSPEFGMLRQIYAQRVLEGTLEPSKGLAKMSPELQQLMFPGTTLEQMRQLAKDMDFLMGARGVQETAKSMAAVSKVEHPWGSIPGGKMVGKIVPGVDAGGRYMLGSYYKLVTEIFSSPAFMRWVQKGLNGDEAAREMTRQQVQRLMQKGGAVGAGVGQGAYQAPPE